MMRLDHEYHYDLTPETITTLVVERRAPLSAAAKASRSRTRVPSPPRGEGQGEGRGPKKRAPRTKKIG
jgi:hypothetical protein